MSLATLPDQRPEREPERALPSLGAVFGGRYRVLEPLRADADGGVYRARDDILARDVAVKVFHADPTAGSAHPRRLAGARALTAMDHPSLVTLYDAHLSPGGLGYLVMELIPGPSLRDHLDAVGALPPTQAAAVLRDVAHGLAAIHGAGIVHQHVTSSNVLLRPLRAATRPFRGVLTEFRLSHLLGEDPESADYLPPEQVSGGAARAESDVYALGLLALEALTGERPLSGGAMQELLLTPLSYDPEIPTRFGYGWELLLTAMTDPDPQKRPSAAEVADLAAELSEGGGLPAPSALPAETPATDAGADLAAELPEDGVLPAPSALPTGTAAAAEPIAALRAIDQSRETASAFRRRRAVWAWVTHYR